MQLDQGLPKGDSTVIALQGTIPWVVTGGSSSSYITFLDEASATITYVGSADPGTAGSSASWSIKRLNQLGSVLQIQYADGDANFDNIWDNRAALSYS